MFSVQQFAAWAQPCRSQCPAAICGVPHPFLRIGLLPTLAYASGAQKAGCSPQPCACAGLCTPMRAQRQHAAGSQPLPCPRGPGPPRLVRLYASIGRPCYGCCAQAKLSLKAPCCGIPSCLSHAPHASRAQDLSSVQTDVPGKNSGSPLEYCTNSAVPQGCKEGLQP